MAQSKIYLDANGNELKGTGAYLNDRGEISGPAASSSPVASSTSMAHIGPVTADDTTPVTLGDLIDHPSLAVQRMVSITKKAVSDPRVMIPLAVGAGIGALRATGVGTGTVPQAVGEVAAEVAPAAARKGIGQALRENVTLDDVVEAIPGAKTAKAAYRVGRGIQQAIKDSRSPVETPGGPMTPPEAPPAPAAAPAPSIPATVPDDVLTPAEMTQAAKWHAQGVPPKVIVQRILQSRELTAKLGTATPDEAAAKVQSALHTGKF